MLLNSAILLALAFHNGVVNAIRHDVLKHNHEMATQNLYPDGTPMDPDMSDMLRRRQAKPEAQFQTEWARLPLDHWDSGAGTFLNRFWVTEDNYKAGGPVFIYDAGEGDALSTANAMLSSGSFFSQIVKKFHGIGVAWEHRYYGASTPNGTTISIHTPATTFKYLNTEQALADVPAFAWNFSRPNLPGVDLTPGNTPWIFIGGSYPGIRAAFVRHTYPETIHASYAASAPVQASVDMSFYFEPIWQGMNANGLGNCSADVHAAIQEFDKIMEDDNQSAALKERFLGKGGSQNQNSGFADALSTIFWTWQSYGADGGRTGLSSFCNWISTDPDTQTTSGASGWAATKGVQFTIDRWVTWPNWIETVNNNMATKCLGPYGTADRNTTVKATSTCDMGSITQDVDMISWMWQYCTQWGFMQSSNIGDHQLVSKYNSQQHQQEMCLKQFPDGIASGLLPASPKAAETNDKYGGWAIRPSNTFWTGGRYDPWRTLSPLSDMPFSPNNKAVQTIPACEKADEVADSPVFGYLLSNAEHCFDFTPSFNESLPARTLFDEALTSWLGCYTPHARKTDDTGETDTDDSDDSDEDDDGDYTQRVAAGSGLRRVVYP